MGGSVNYRYILLLIVLGGVFFSVFFWRESLDGFTALFVELRSEYTAVEQLSKFCLIVSLLSCFYLLRVSGDRDLLRASAALFALTITIYLSESNMIRDKYQPVFGMVLILPIAFWLARARNWLSFCVFGLGVFITGMGSLKDFMIESEKVLQMIPPILEQVLRQINEEVLDTIGLGVISLSALCMARDALSELVVKTPLGFAGALLAGGLVAVGNGLAHYQYDPSVLLLGVSFVFSALGLMLFAVMDSFFVLAKYSFPMNRKLKFLSVPFLLFLFIPVFWDQYNNFMSLFFWLGSIYLSRQLYKQALETVSTSPRAHTEEAAGSLQF